MPRQRKVTRVAQLTREKIIKAASRAFARDGYEGASIRAIVAAAEVNQAAINYHFGWRSMSGSWTGLPIRSPPGQRTASAGSQQRGDYVPRLQRPSSYPSGRVAKCLSQQVFPPPTRAAQGSRPASPGALTFP